MTIASIVGARPQFIKAAPLLRAIAQRHRSALIHSGQHYDAPMSDVFFRELGLPAPDVHLNVGSQPHGAQTGAMLIALEPALTDAKPDWVVIYGDTNTTLAGALVASKLGIPLAHVEAGLRSFNRCMPEEINRLVADTLADLRFCPSGAAVANLSDEGITRGVHRAADTMIDVLAESVARAKISSTILERAGLKEKQFVLATIHRAENTDDAARLKAVVDGLSRAGETVVWPVHPRTRQALAAAGVLSAVGATVKLIDPLGHLDMVRLESAARVIVTDSGGVQKEAYWLGVPCVTVRDETEWVETVQAGWNTLVAADGAAIVAAIGRAAAGSLRPTLYADGLSADGIVRCLEEARPQ